MDEIDQQIANNSKRRKIMRILAENSNEKGYVSNLTSNEIAEKLNLSAAEVNNALWMMQKEELVGFTENKQSHYLTRFRLRRKALESIDGGNAKEVAEAIQQPHEAQPIDLGVTMPADAEPVKKYPALKRLFDRSSRLRKALELLEGTNADEAAIKVLEELENMSEVEKEIVQYFEDNIDQKLKVVHDS
jgi:DNA-binding Lrp family transcriptional regulator